MLEQWKRYVLELFEWLGEMNSSEPEHLMVPIKAENEPYPRVRR